MNSMYSHEINLDFVGSDIDLGTLKPIDSNQLVTLINEYLSLGVNILTSFCTKSEEQIFCIEKSLETSECQLALLEKKLMAVDIFKHQEGLQEIKDILHEHQGDDISEQEDIEPKNEPIGDSDNRSTENIFTPVYKIKIHEHPSVCKYFRMLRMGVPEMAVRQKMEAEGVDSSILRDPDKLVDT